MTAAERQPVADAPERTVAFIVPDALYQALLDLCESRGWSADGGLGIAIAYGVRFLQGEDDTSYEQIAQLRAENARFCAENAQLRDWIDQCQARRAPGIATVDAPSPAWPWRRWPWVRR